MNIAVLQYVSKLANPVMGERYSWFRPLCSEGTHKMSEGERSGEHKARGDEIKIIADAIRERFGKDAWHVAMRQTEATERQSSETWQAVLALLSI